MTFLMIYNIAIYADDNTLNSMFDQAFNLWQHLEVAAELGFDLWDTKDWRGSRLFILIAWKNQCFVWSIL